MNKNAFLPGSLWLCCQLAYSSLALATETDSFQPYVNEKIFYDSNLLLLPNKNDRPFSWPGSQRADVVNQLTAGAKFESSFKRQKFHADLSVRDNRYANNQPLNYIGTDDKLSWDWRLGKHFYGQLAYGYQQYMDSFSYYQTILNNIISANNAVFDVKYTWHPRWTLKGGVDFLDTSNSNEQRLTFNRQNTKTVMSLNYLISTNYTQAIEYSYTNVDYINRPPNYRSDRDNQYAIESIGVKSFWYLCPKKLHLITELNETMLKNAHFSNRDFSSPTGKLTLTWDVSSKVQWVLIGWRDVLSSQSSYGSYVITEGISPSLEWRPRAKLTFKARYAYRTDNYSGPSSADVVRNSSNIRLDTVTTTQAEVIYKPHSDIELGLTLKAETRDSSLSVWSYTDYISAVSAKLTF